MAENTAKYGWVFTVTLTKPSLKNNTADADRLAQAVRQQLKADNIAVDIDLDLLQRLPRQLRAEDFRVRCVFFRDRGHAVVLQVQTLREPSPLGLAVDLGTSRVVLRVVNLESGRILGETAFTNPQTAFGPDILARIHHAEKRQGLQDLQQSIVAEINRRSEDLCQSLNRAPSDVVLAAVAGNTAMTHLFLGLDPRGLIREPYIPVINRPGFFRASELNLRLNPYSRVFVFPNIGSYFGGDVIAGILYSGIHRTEDHTLMVDVGTNAEVVLGNRHWLIACAGAAGPALEGGVTRMGMMAEPGVIDRVVIDPSTHRFRLHTIEDQPPRGICGSGLIDLAAQLFLTGMIDIRGKFCPEVCGNRLETIEGVPHLILVPKGASADGAPLTLSQADLDSLIRSKAAMYTILETLTGTVGISMEELTAFNVAGTFGSFIQPTSAITIGMIPDLPLDRFKVLGNSSLEGATRLLLDAGLTAEVDAIRDRITYLELNVNQDFMNRFSAARFLPHTDLERFPSVQSRLGKPTAAST